MTDKEQKAASLYDRLLDKIEGGLCAEDHWMLNEMHLCLEPLCKLIEQDIAQNTQKIEQLNARTMSSALLG